VLPGALVDGNVVGVVGVAVALGGGVAVLFGAVVGPLSRHAATIAATDAEPAPNIDHRTRSRRLNRPAIRESVPHRWVRFRSTIVPG
jgi:hypothetical protein